MPVRRYQPLPESFLEVIPVKALEAERVKLTISILHSFRSSFNFLDYRRRIYSQSTAQPEYRVDRRHPVTPLNKGDVTHVQPCGLCKFFLGNTGVRTESGYGSSNKRLQIGVIAGVQARYRKVKRPLSSLDYSMAKVPCHPGQSAILIG